MEAYDLGVWYHFRYSSKRYLEKHGHSVEYELYDEPELQTVEEVKEPSKLRVVLAHAGDFFALLWSVLVAQKHKICPLVQLPE